MVLAEDFLLPLLGESNMEAAKIVFME